MDQLTETDSISEMAGFWDTHDVTDFEEALEEVRKPVFQRKQQSTIDLSPSDAQALRRIIAISNGFRFRYGVALGS